MISQAQTTIKYGYLSYQEVLKFMPEYAVAQTKRIWNKEERE